MGIGNWLTYQNDKNNSDSNSNNIIPDLTQTPNDIYPDALKSILSESMTTRCTQVSTKTLLKHSKTYKIYIIYRLEHCMH